MPLLGFKFLRHLPYCQTSAATDYYDCILFSRAKF